MKLKKSSTGAFKTASKIAIQRTAEATGNSVGNKISNIIMGVSKKLKTVKPNQPTKFRAKIWVEKTDDSRETYNTKTQINFKFTVLRLRLCNDSDSYIYVRKTITIANTAATAAVNNTNI